MTRRVEVHIGTGDPVVDSFPELDNLRIFWIVNYQSEYVSLIRRGDRMIRLKVYLHYLVLL